MLGEDVEEVRVGNVVICKPALFVRVALCVSATVVELGS